MLPFIPMLMLGTELSLTKPNPRVTVFYRGGDFGRWLGNESRVSMSEVSAF